MTSTPTSPRQELPGGPIKTCVQLDVINSLKLKESGPSCVKVFGSTSIYTNDSLITSTNTQSTTETLQSYYRMYRHACLRRGRSSSVVSNQRVLVFIPSLHERKMAGECDYH